MVAVVFSLFVQGRYLCDGLHLSPEGNKLLARELVNTTKALFGGLDGGVFGVDLPLWRDMDRKNPVHSVAAHTARTISVRRKASRHLGRA